MAEEIRLTGSFQDDITPKLKKLDKQLKSVTKTFKKFGNQLDKVAKKADNATKSIDRMNSKIAGGMRTQASNVGKASTSWDTYTRSVNRASRAAKSFTPPRPVQAPRPVREPRSRGGGGGYTSSFVQRPGKMPGFGSITAAGFAAGLALNAVERAANLAAQSLGTIVSRADDFQGYQIGLAGTLQTLGGYSWDQATKMSEDVLVDIEKIAAKLPGDTAAYMGVLSNTMDDAIGMFGSADAALKDLKKGERSFTALLGLAAIESKQDPARVNADLAQLKAGNNINQIGILKYNATLKKFYEDFADQGYDQMTALSKALEKTYSPQRVNALRGTISAQIESFITTLTSPRTGLLGGLRKIKVDGITTTFIAELGKLFNALEELGNTLVAMGADPMVPLTRFIKFLTELSQTLDTSLKGGTSLLNGVADFFGLLTAGLTNEALSIDYTEIVKAVDRFFYTLFSNIDYGLLVGRVGEIITAAFQSPTGAVIAFAGLVKAVNAATAAFTAIKALKIGATISGWLGAVGPTIASLKVAFSTLLIPVAAIAAKILLVIAAVLGVVAIFRHMDFILSSTVEGLKILYNSLKWIAAISTEKVVELWHSIAKFLQGAASKIGLGWMFEPAVKATESMLKKVRKERIKTEGEIAKSAAKIADNTAKSWQRTQEDFGKISDVANGLFNSADPAATALNNLSAAAENAQSSFENNTKFSSDGKAYGWAILNGVKIMVPWGSVAGTGGDEPKAKKVTGLTPKATDMEWYRKMMEKQGTPIPSSAAETNQAVTQVSNNIVKLAQTTKSTETNQAVTQVSNNIVKLAQTTKSTSGKLSQQLGEISSKLSSTLNVKLVGTLATTPGAAKDGHTHKVHTAYALGSGNPAFFASQKEAVSWEKMMAPADSRIASVTSNSSEFVSKNVSNNYNVSISIDGAGMNEDDMANTVADKFLAAIKKATYSELELT